MQSIFSSHCSGSSVLSAIEYKLLSTVSCIKVKLWIMESLMLGKTSKIIESSINPALPSPPLNHVPKCHIWRSFKYLLVTQPLPWAACSSVSTSKPFNFPFQAKVVLVPWDPRKKVYIIFYINMKINNASSGSCVAFWILSRFL